MARHPHSPATQSSHLVFGDMSVLPQSRVALKGLGRVQTVQKLQETRMRGSVVLTSFKTTKSN